MCGNLPDKAITLIHFDDQQISQSRDRSILELLALMSQECRRGGR